MRGYIPFNVVAVQSSKNVCNRPNLLEAADNFLSFLLITLVAKQFIVCFDSAVDGVAPSVPESDFKEKNFLIKGMSHPLAPYGPQELGTQDVPRCVRID